MVLSNIPQGTGPKLEAIDGAVAPASVHQAGPESDLDFQVAYALIYPQSAIFFQTDDPVYEANCTFSGFLNTFLDALDGSYCSTISPLDPPLPRSIHSGCCLQKSIAMWCLHACECIAYAVECLN
jgi:tripeptidyl-peptidase-1